MSDLIERLHGVRLGLADYSPTAEAICKEAVDSLAQKDKRIAELIAAIAEMTLRCTGEGIAIDDIYARHGI